MNGLLFHLTIPAMVTRVMGVLCGVISHVCVKRVPNRNDTTLAKINMYVPVVVVVSTFTTLMDTNNTPETSVDLNGNSGSNTRGVLKNYFLLRLVLSIILATILLV